MQSENTEGPYETVSQYNDQKKKRKKDKILSTKCYTENERLSNMNPTEHYGSWKGKQFLLDKLVSQRFVFMNNNMYLSYRSSSTSSTRRVGPDYDLMLMKL